MEVETTLAKGIETAGENVRYDAACRRLLSEKSILAWIMKSCLEEYRDWLAQGLVCLINVLQPEVICLGGCVSNAEDELLLLPLREMIADRCFDPEHPPKLVRAALGNDAGVVGAAMLCKTL